MIYVLRITLGHTGIADEGLFVSRTLGAEGKVKGNILAGDECFVSYGHAPTQILAIVYSSSVIVYLL